MLPPAYLEFESRRLENGIGYIRFNTFHEDLIPDMVAAIAELKDAPGIIVDLRGNPGGDPNAAEQLAAQFLDGQFSFGRFRFREGSSPRKVDGKNIYNGPLVVLIDALSFSGSEYFAYGMQTLGRAVIVGERSPGGLTAMNIAKLPNDAILGYPVAQIVTSDGRVLEGYGVIPDIPVTLDRGQLLKGVDAQLQAAIQFIYESGK
jgi:carboxyl-terminal processing protease